MLDAIVTSLGNTNTLIAIPTAEIELKALVGKKARYLDNSDRNWEGMVTGLEDPGVVVKFEKFPTGIGQGQIIHILDDGEEESD